MHEAHIGAGVCIGVDLMDPGRWQSISADVMDDAATSLLSALTGSRVPRRLPAFDVRSAVPRHPNALAWTRVAVVDALDRWLDGPYDQALVDAERGVARHEAARRLPADAQARAVVIGEALSLTRRASAGMVGYLQWLAARRPALPAALVCVLGKLVEGYGELLAEVDRAPDRLPDQPADRALAAVLRAWEPLAERETTTEADVLDVRHRTSRRSSASQPASMIDPRQVRSRVFALAADPAVGEITLAADSVGGHPAVRVRVPAYRRALDQPVVQRLLVRLVDKRSADQRGRSVLHLAPKAGRSSPTVYLEGVVPLPESDVDHVRADVFDALSDVPPADTDDALVEVRRATVFLSEWRRLVAAVQLSGAGSAPSRRLRELAARLSPVEAADRPLFMGGPSANDLITLADRGDADIVRREREDGSGGDLFALVRGPARPLVAEIAAAGRG